MVIYIDLNFQFQILQHHSKNKDMSSKLWTNFVIYFIILLGCGVMLAKLSTSDDSHDVPYRLVAITSE